MNMAEKQEKQQRSGESGSPSPSSADSDRIVNEKPKSQGGFWGLCSRLGDLPEWKVKGKPLEGRDAQLVYWLYRKVSRIP